MTHSPFLWLAGVACALGGAVAGHALGSAPVIHRPAIERLYQSHDDGAVSDRASYALPDHYALVTRNGTVPAAELADRGLYSQERYRDLYATADYEAASHAEADDPDPASRSQYWGDDEALRIGDPALQPEMVPANLGADERPSEPLTFADGAEAASQTGDARLIDVSATLAMR